MGMMNKMCCECDCVNAYERLLNYSEKINELLVSIENDVTSFIKRDWNKDLNFCVEINDCNELSVFVADDVPKSNFELFIIKPICEKYNLKVSYCEIVESEVCPYIEWVLYHVDKKICN